MDALVRQGQRPEDNGRLCQTIKACGLAFDWTIVGCQRHKGRVVTYDQDSMYNDSTPLLLAFDRENIVDVQDVLNLIIVDSAEGESAGKSDEWPKCERHCFFCKEEKHEQVPVKHTMRVTGGAPTHFFAQNIRFHRPRGGGHEVQQEEWVLCELDPSLRITMFGSVYMLVAVVYFCTKSKHFSAQVYLPKAPCWITYDSLDGGKAHCKSEFDQDFFAGKAYMFLYVQHDILDSNGCLAQFFDYSGDTDTENDPASETREVDRAVSLLHFVFDVKRLCGH